MKSDTGNRVVITGLGAVTALGPDLPAFLEGLERGRCGIRPIRLFDTSSFRTSTGAELDGFQPDLHFNRKEQKRLSRVDMACLIAAQEAMAQAGYRKDEDSLSSDVGVILGGGVGGLFESEIYYRHVLRDGWRSVQPGHAVGHFPSSTSDRIAEHFGLTGLRSTVVTACSSSTHAIGQAFNVLRSGRAEAVITGGGDSFSRLTYSGFNALRSVDPQPCRPFDLNRKGLSLGEGAALFVLETLDRAKSRGIPIHGEIIGHGMSSDAHHMTAPDPGGKGAALAMVDAMRSACISPEAVDYINAHGTGTPHNDVAETKAIHRVFGRRARDVPVSSTKSMIGHCLGSAGAVEALATVLALREGFLPPTIHLETPDPECDLDYVPMIPRKRSIRVALSNSFAFGGNNGVLVFRRYDED